ncbi:hypothetical protein JXO59_11365 [candidate division KSB1 bacterium]|nr:hypothetical protein [candidate division KSB1 bacterium]
MPGNLLRLPPFRPLEDYMQNNNQVLIHEGILYTLLPDALPGSSTIKRILDLNAEFNQYINISLSNEIGARLLQTQWDHAKGPISSLDSLLLLYEIQQRMRVINEANTTVEEQPNNNLIFTAASALKNQIRQSICEKLQGKKAVLWQLFSPVVWIANEQVRILSAAMNGEISAPLEQLLDISAKRRRGLRYAFNLGREISHLQSQSRAQDKKETQEEKKLTKEIKKQSGRLKKMLCNGTVTNSSVDLKRRFYLQTDRIVKEIAEQALNASQDSLRQLMVYYDQARQNVVLESFKCGDFETRRLSGGEYLFGVHTGCYFMQQSYRSKTFLKFPNALVAVILSNADIRQYSFIRSLPHPVVVNSYGPHPFLRDRHMAFQSICMGNTAIEDYAMQQASLPERILNLLFKAAQVMRSGHNSENECTYYHAIDKDIFNPLRVDKSVVDKNPQAYVSYYSRSQNDE